MIADAINCFLAAAGGTNYGTHRYWRIFISQNSGDATSTQVQEIEFHSTVGGADITGSGTAMSGGSGSDTAAASNAFDNGTGGWQRSSATNTWIGYDFGSAKTIAEFVITAPHTGGQFTQGPQSFTLDWSDDGTTWTTAASFTAYGWLIDQVRTYPETAPATGYHRFWRLFCTDNNGGTTFVGIGEIEFRATSGGADQTTAQTSNNGSTTGRIIGSSISGAGNEGYKAFNNTVATNSDWWAASGTTNQWVAYVFASPVTVLEAMLQATAVGTQLTRQVKNGKIEWSDDGDKVGGGSWTTAGTFTQNGWTASQTITVAVTP
jgi:hypothetical protein